MRGRQRRASAGPQACVRACLHARGTTAQPHGRHGGNERDPGGTLGGPKPIPIRAREKDEKRKGTLPSGYGYHLVRGLGRAGARRVPARRRGGRGRRCRGGSGSPGPESGSDGRGGRRREAATRGGGGRCRAGSGCSACAPSREGGGTRRGPKRGGQDAHCGRAAHPAARFGRRRQEEAPSPSAPRPRLSVVESAKNQAQLSLAVMAGERAAMAVSDRGARRSSVKLH